MLVTAPRTAPGHSWEGGTKSKEGVLHVQPQLLDEEVTWSAAGDERRAVPRVEDCGNLVHKLG